MKQTTMKLNTASMLKELYQQFNTGGYETVPGALEAFSMWRRAFVKIAEIAARLDDPDLWSVLEQIGVVHCVKKGSGDER